MYAFKVDRYRYHVVAVDDDGTVEAWGTAGARPYLMLDQGLSDADGNAIDRVIAPDVEDLQVAYVYPLAPSGAQVLGATGAAVTANTAGNDAGFNLDPSAPFVIPGFGTAPTDLAPRPHDPSPRQHPGRARRHHRPLAPQGHRGAGCDGAGCAQPARRGR